MGEKEYLEAIAGAEPCDPVPGQYRELFRNHPDFEEILASRDRGLLYWESSGYLVTIAQLKDHWCKQTPARKSQ